MDSRFNLQDIKEALPDGIAILGAGPAGTTAAIQLAQMGIPTRLIDKAEFPRDKVCGDALSGKVVDILKKIDPKLLDGLDQGSEYLPCWGVRFVAPSSEALDVPFKLDYEKLRDQQIAPGFISPRLDFDNYMLEAAIAYPEVELLSGQAVRKIERTKDGFELFSKDASLGKCSLLLAADGAQSVAVRDIFQRRVEPRHHCAAVRAYYKGVEGTHPDQFIELIYLKDLLPAYFWVFPLSEGRCNVGLGLRSDLISKKKFNLTKLMEEIIQTHPQIAPRFKNAERMDSIRGFGLPLGSKKRSLSQDGVMLLGDAASLIDPFTGEGIGNAMISGRLAAMQIAESLQKRDFTADTFKAYDQAVYRQLWSELKLSHMMQRLASYPSLFNFVVRKANRNPVLRETISCMFEDLDMRARLQKPSFYFNLLFARDK